MNLRSLRGPPSSYLFAFARLTLMCRISRLEMLDEIEELELVLAHYAITWGCKLPANSAELKAQWVEWGLKRKETHEL